MSLSLKRNKEETWLEALLRQASEFGLESEVQSEYDFYISKGRSESEAAFYAAESWDILDYEED